MYKLKNSWSIIVLIFFISAISSISNDLIIIEAQGAVEPTLESDIIIGIDLAHQNNITQKELTNLTTILNATFSSEKVVFLRAPFTSSGLSNIDVLTILSPTSSYSETEIELAKDFIKRGKSLLVGTGFRNQTQDPINNLIAQFGLHFNLSSSLIPEAIRNQENQTIEYSDIARNFTTPIIPITENISQLLLPNSLGISFNDTKLETYQSPSIVYYHPILLKNLDDDPSENNTYTSTLEFENGARIFAIGSSDMFNNTYIEPLENTTTLFLDNTEFIINAIKWLGRNTGIIKFYDSWVDLDNLSIQKDSVIHGNVTLLTSQNKTLIQGQLTIALERDDNILKSKIMRVNPNNASKYFGSIDVENIKPGWCDVLFVAKHIGYLPLELRAGRVFIEPPYPSPILPNLSLWGLFIAVVILFVATAFLVRMNIYGKEK